MPAALLFMNLIGPGKSKISGEAQVEGYEGDIELSDWNWALVRGKDKKKGAKAEPSVFSFSKSLDRSTTALLTCLRTGQVLPSAEITLEEGSEAEFELTVTLNDIRVLEYELEGEMSDKEGSLTENWVFNYHTIKFDYKPSKSLPPNERGLLQVLLTRSPGASTEPVSSSSQTETKINDLLDKLPADERKPLWKRVDKRLDELPKLPPAGGPGGGKTEKK